ncbi:MAG: IS200/IS605 family transposase [Blastocatellia bacterium]
MGHTHTSSLFHYVFSTKNREKIITPQVQERLWPYMGGIARENRVKAIEIGGVEDHVNMLLSLPATITLAKAVQLTKGGSSKWVNENMLVKGRFEWQEGYGAFSIGKSQIDDTVAYIRNQAEHHRKRTFKEEYVAFLKAHDLEYDERYIWD